MRFEITFGFILIFLAFLPTQGNAKYILSGYNTMPEKDRAHVNLVGLLRYLKHFHIFLGLSLLIICTILRLFSDSAADVFMITYTIAAYGFMGLGAEKFHLLSAIQKTFNRIIAAVLWVITLVILYLSFISFRNSEVIIEKNQIEITGIYGVRILKQEIEAIELLRELPAITSKTSGFNGGFYKKGSFRTKQRQRIKLFINTNTSSYIFFKTEEGDVYFSSDELDMNKLYHKLSLWKGKS